MQNIMYKKPTCPYCVRAAQILKNHNIEFIEIDISQDSLALKEMLEKSGGRKTVPQIFLNGRHVGGCDDLEALQASGELEAFLSK